MTDGVFIVADKSSEDKKKEPAIRDQNNSLKQVVKLVFSSIIMFKNLQSS